MKWRYAVVVFILLVLVAARLAMGTPDTLTFTGQVDMAMGTDGSVLVLVDEGTAAQPNDGLVDHAFRLQQGPPVAYSGQATVVYVRGRLTVELDGDTGWAFTVAGRDLPAPDPALSGYVVQGISHMWGASINEPPASLFSALSSGTCTRPGLQAASGIMGAGGDGVCRDCVTGGQGRPTCSIDCGAGNCDADCGEGFFACCTCPRSCTCCGSSVFAAPHP